MTRSDRKDLVTSAAFAASVAIGRPVGMFRPSVLGFEKLPIAVAPRDQVASLSPNPRTSSNQVRRAEPARCSDRIR